MLCCAWADVDMVAVCAAKAQGLDASVGDVMVQLPLPTTHVPYRRQVASI
jgi:hypothetical protein